MSAFGGSIAAPAGSGVGRMNRSVKIGERLDRFGYRMAGLDKLWDHGVILFAPVDLEKL
jgi:hypothetical protein